MREWALFRYMWLLQPKLQADMSGGRLHGQQSARIELLGLCLQVYRHRLVVLRSDVHGVSILFLPRLLVLRRTVLRLYCARGPVGTVRSPMLLVLSIGVVVAGLAGASRIGGG